VTPVLNIQVQQPAALLAAHAQVSELLPYAGAVNGTTQTPQRIRVQGTSGFAAKQSVTDMDPVGGVRGKPPRGRPV
jgi:hypothetical protein